jgi:hypothetical protein
MKLFPVVFLASCAWLYSACSGSVQHHLDDINAQLRVSDSVSFDLKAIDTTLAEALLQQSTVTKEQFKAVVKDDTLSLEFAEQLNAYVKGNAALEDLVEERRSCMQANTDARKRLEDLRSDMENGSGERGKYGNFVRNETREMRVIRQHSVELKQRFDGAKAAIEQFQPDLERFISRFTPPMP